MPRRSTRRSCFSFKAEDGIRYLTVTGVQTCALPISGAVERFFGGRSGDAAQVHFDQKQMVVRAASDDSEAVLGDGCGHGLGVGHHLLLIFLDRKSVV